ncbi:MAG TPA: hypothetical protein VH575_34730 [Gemmataceae bacterium]|jgi:hypothetical protein
MSELADKLRERIEAKHAKALQALSELEAYLEDPDLLRENGATEALSKSSVTSSAMPKTRQRREDSFRARVLSVITASWASVNAIATQTGLNVRQVRGVINAPGVARQLERRPSMAGETEYHLQSEVSN